MSEDILSDPPPQPPDRPEDALPGPAENEAAEIARRRPRVRGGRGRRGNHPGSMDGEGEEAGPDEIAEAVAPEPKAEIGPAEGPGDSPTPISPPPAQSSPELRSPGDRRDTRDPRDPRDPRRDFRAPRPDPRPPRPDPRPPRPETREPRRDSRPPRPEREPRQDRPPRPDRSLLDPNELSDMAWQLFFGELREEGLALVDDAEAEKLTNRCFKLTEIFLRTRQRRLNQLFGGGTVMVEDRQRDEARGLLPPKPKAEIPIEKRLPDDPSHLSKLETEALIEEAREVAEQPHRPEDGTEIPPEVPATHGTSPLEAPIPAEPPSPDDGGD